MIKVKDGYAKLVGTTYLGSANHLLRSNGDTWEVHTGRNNEADKIVRTDGSGYLQTGWISTTSGDMGTTSINRVYCSNDSYIRYKTPANFFSSLTNNGDNLSITIASQNRTLTVLYARIADLLRSKGTIAPQTGRTLNLGDVYSYHLNTSVSGGPTTNAAVIGFGKGTSGTVEIAGEWTSGRGLWVRALRNVTDNWYAWDKVLTLATYTGITDSRYYTKTLADERFVNVTDFTGLKVGGRNLLRNSNVMLSANAYRIGSYYFSQKPVVGARYTLVICAKCGVNNTKIEVYQDEGYRGIGAFTSKQESVQSFSFTYSSERNSSYMTFYQQPNGIFGGSYVKWAILVEGNVPPTSWSPAPEDQVSDWNTIDVNSFSFIKNKPTTLSQFTDNIGIATHITNKSNPHSVTKAQVGLGNVDNTSDLNKPISNATQAALNTKFDKTGGRLTTGTGNVNIELWRGANASWNILNSGGYLRFQSNYTTVAGAYFDTLKLDYNTGNAVFKGNVTAPTFSGALSGNASSATNLSRSILAGNGLTGGGALNANRTLTLGTPSNITATSTNSVTASSHTHNLVMGTGSGLDADLLDGQHGSRYLKALGGANYITFTVGGDANTYYPVVISSVSAYYPLLFVNISRAYNEQAPDSWNTATHRGGLTLTLLWNGSQYWDGNGSGGQCYIVYLYLTYCTMFGGKDTSTSGAVVWLRGGGAIYHVHAMNGTSVIATVYTSTYTDSAKRVFASITTPRPYSVRWPGTSLGADILTNTLTFSAGKFSSKTYNGSSAITVNVPTHTSHLTNNSGFLTGNVIRAVSANGFWGMADPSSNTGVWIRTTNQGIIPYQSGGKGSGHCGLGTSSWYFSSAYIDTVHGNLDGTATNADKLDGYHATSGDNKPWGTIPVITTTGYMDIGKQLEFHNDNSTGSDFSTLLRCTGNYSNVVNLPSGSGTLALITDNVASASKLSTSRTIWGQTDTNGTGNISGQLYNAGSFHIGEGGNEINMVSDQPMYLGYRRTSEINIHTGTTGGTTNSVTAKFNNNGLYLYKGWFRSTGDSGWYSETYGGGIRMTDSTWIRTYAGKGFYCDSENRGYKVSSITGFYKDGSSDSYVLLGGGGHKAISDFAVKNHNHNSLYVTALGTSGNYVTWTKNGTTNNLTVPYATNADKLDGYHATSGNNKPWGTIPVINTSGWMDIGKHLEFHFDNTTGSDYSTLLRCTGNHSNAVNLPSASGTLALITDNVASATKLETARTIWGQSFDGTENITGNFTLGKGNYLATSGDSALVWNVDDKLLRLGGYTSGSQVTIRTNLGIGTETPTTPLDVVGNAKVSGNIISTFIKSGSNDNYVLLGGGGHKAISDFATSNRIILNTKVQSDGGTVDMSTFPQRSLVCASSTRGTGVILPETNKSGDIVVITFLIGCRGVIAASTGTLINYYTSISVLAGTHILMYVEVSSTYACWVVISTPDYELVN